MAAAPLPNASAPQLYGNTDEDDGDDDDAPTTMMGDIFKSP
jgi:hypothetical protein